MGVLTMIVSKRLVDAKLPQGEAIDLSSHASKIEPESIRIVPAEWDGYRWAPSGSPLVAGQDYTVRGTMVEPLATQAQSIRRILLTFEHEDDSEKEEQKDAEREANHRDLRDKYQTALAWLDDAKQSDNIDIKQIAKIVEGILRLMRLEIGDE